MFRKNTLFFCFVALSRALPQLKVHPSDICKDVFIPVQVSVPRLNFDIAINDNWDTAALAFNLTLRPSRNVTSSSKVETKTPEPIKSSYQVAATLCGTGSTILVLTHGILESKKYKSTVIPILGGRLRLVDIGILTFRAVISIAS